MTRRAVRRAVVLRTAGSALLLTVLAGVAFADDAPSPLPAPTHVPGGGAVPRAVEPVDSRVAGPVPAACAAMPDPPPPPPPPSAPSDGTTRPSPFGRPLRDRFNLRVDKQVGQLLRLQAAGGLRPYLLTGNPEVTSTTGLSIRAREIVVWLDEAKTPSLLKTLGGPGDTGEPKAGTPPKEGSPAGGQPEPTAELPGSEGAIRSSAGSSVVPDAIVGVYASGSVELKTADLVFRASELYFDARKDQALLVEPRYDTRVNVAGPTNPVPLHVRAQRARVVSSGLAVFDDAEASTSRASDALILRLRRLTVEEYAALEKGDFLGFNPPTLETFTQRYTAEEIRVRGERLPLFAWPAATFGGEKGFGEYPVVLRTPTVGNRSSLGYWGIFGVGRDQQLSDTQELDWTVRFGGYTRRGPAGGVEVALQPKRPKGLDPFAFFPSTYAKLDTFYVHDEGNQDRNDFEFPDQERAFAKFEGRWDPRPEWRLDAEANVFTDRGFNREYFESDERNHKDRETYVRGRWTRGGTAATLMYGFHARDFVTESIREPSLDVWSESVPLTPPTFAIALDLSSQASFARLARRFDEQDELDDDYHAVRLDVVERVYAPFDLGDVRVSPFVGFHGTGYYDRDDGGDDVTRAAMEAGVRVNLQLHRDFAAYGGCWSLDGLRSIIELDAGFYSRFLDDTDADEVPSFDRLEPDENRTEITLEGRTRLETRRTFEGRRGNVTLLDARATVSLWPDEIGPYGKRGIGEVETRVSAEVMPSRAWIRGESIFDLERGIFQHATIGGLYSPQDDFGLAIGLRQQHHEATAPWFDGWWRWSEKWGLRASAIKDITKDSVDSVRLVLVRFSDDHVIRLGVKLRSGHDFSLVLSLEPAIGGVPTAAPFDPQDEIDFGEFRR